MRPSTCVLLLGLLPGLGVPALASAEWPKIESGQTPTHRVPKDARQYVLVERKAPLRLAVTGPGSLTLTLRQAYARRRRPTKIEVRLDGRSVATARLALKGALRSPTLKGLKVTRPRTLVVAVPAGPHEVIAAVQSSGRKVLVEASFAAETEDLDEIPLVPLAGTNASPEVKAQEGAAATADADVDEIPVVPLVAEGETASEGSEIDEIPLVPLTGEDSAAATPSEPGAVARTAPATGGEGGEAPPAGETLAAGGPAAGTPVETEILEPAAARAPAAVPPRPAPGLARLEIGLYGLGSTNLSFGLPNAQPGGALEVTLRPGPLAGRLFTGLALAFVPARQRYVDPASAREVDRGTLSLTPIAFTAGYTLGDRALRLDAFLGAGVALAGLAQDGRRVGATGVAPAFVFGGGPSFAAGPGRVAVGLRGAAATVDVEGPGLRVRGTVWTLALSVGYQIGF